jgi:hypothetical protein
MTIKEQIKLLEGLAEEDIKSLNPKDRLNYYNSLKEFELPKMQRSPFQTEAQLPDKITIKVVNGN